MQLGFCARKNCTLQVEHHSALLLIMFCPCQPWWSGLYLHRTKSHWLSDWGGGTILSSAVAGSYLFVQCLQDVACAAAWMIPGESGHSRSCCTGCDGYCSCLPYLPDSRNGNKTHPDSVHASISGSPGALQELMKKGWIKGEGCGALAHTPSYGGGSQGPSPGWDSTGRTPVSDADISGPSHISCTKRAPTQTGIWQEVRWSGTILLTDPHYTGGFQKENKFPLDLLQGYWDILGRGGAIVIQSRLTLEFSHPDFPKWKVPCKRISMYTP